MTYTLILITTSNKKEAVKIANALLDRKIAACINIIKGIDSYFIWKDKAVKAKECLLFVKTKRGLVSDIIKTVRSIHSYKLPEIITLDISGGYVKYLDWIGAQTKKSR